MQMVKKEKEKKKGGGKGLHEFIKWNKKFSFSLFTDLRQNTCAQASVSLTKNSNSFGESLNVIQVSQTPPNFSVVSLF